MSDELDFRSRTVADAAKLLKAQPKIIRAHIRRSPATDRAVLANQNRRAGQKRLLTGKAT